MSERKTKRRGYGEGSIFQRAGAETVSGAENLTPFDYRCPVDMMTVLRTTCRLYPAQERIIRIRITVPIREMISEPMQPRRLE
jgi:hypothetical protein